MTGDPNYTEEELLANASPDVLALYREKMRIANNGPGAPGPCEATVRRKRGDATDKAAPSMRESEADFESWVVDLAHVRGWKVAGFRPARTNKGWRTAVKYEGAGFPDLVLVRESRLLFVEVKSEEGELSPEQENWQREIQTVSYWLTYPKAVQFFVWRPSDRPEIERILA